jgi:acetolactate synthase-1/2/3 large subunit
VRHRIGVIAIVFNDGYFTNVRRMQEEQHGGRVLATDLHNPDFVAFARSFGARGCRAETPQALAEAIVASRGRDVPTLIEVPMPSVPDPWPLLRPR